MHNSDSNIRLEINAKKYPIYLLTYFLICKFQINPILNRIAYVLVSNYLSSSVFFSNFWDLL